MLFYFILFSGRKRKPPFEALTFQYQVPSPNSSFVSESEERKRKLETS